jgi:MarR family
MAGGGSSPGWTFLSNHGHVLVCIAEDPDQRLRDIALRVGITERAVFSIVNDLEADGYVRRVPVGRRNRYELDPSRPLRHPVERVHSIGELLGALTSPKT